MARPEGTTPRDDGPEIDAAFAQIVARLRESEQSDHDLPSPDPAPPDRPAPDSRPPAKPGVNPSPFADSPPPAPPAPVPWRVDPTGSVADALLGDQEWAGEDPDERFVPGPTAPLPPRRDRTFWIALLGLTIGPALVIWVALVGPGGSTLMRIGIITMVAGSIALVLRQPTRRGENPDNGARV